MKYSKPILIFGGLIPIAISILIAAIGAVAYHSFATIRDEKESMYAEVNEKEASCHMLESKIEPHKLEMKFNDGLLTGNTPADFSSFLENQLDGALKTELSKQSLNFPTAITIPEDRQDFSYQELNMSFAGRYDAMESLSLEIETKFPQLKLEGYDISRVTTGGQDSAPNVSYRLNFRALTKPKAPTTISTQ